MPNIDIEGLATDYPAGFRIEPHAHDAHQIVHAASGVLRVQSEGAVWVTPPGRAIWMPAGRVHAISCRTPVSMRTVYLRDPAGALERPCEVWSVSGLMREIVIRLASDPAPAGREHLLALLLLEIRAVDALPLSLPEPRDPRLRRIAEALAADPADPRSLRDWARDLGFSERTLIRRFQSETGVSFRQWRRQARMLAALELLGAGASVTSAALDVGYSSVSAFIAAFREAFGRPPGGYFG